MDNTDKQPVGGHAVDSCKSPETSLAEDDQVWEDSPLGLPGTWPEALRAYSKTTSSLAYPAAVFWGEDMVLLHNYEWTKINGPHDQGQKQRGKLSVDAFNALSASLHGGAPKTIDSSALLRDRPAIEMTHYTVLISPLFGDTHSNESGASGSLVQLTPPPSAFGSAKLDAKSGLSLLREDQGASEERKDPKKECDMSKLGQTIASISFDEHPVFHRFAEMLPSGLAILDRDAKAVFVNQHFYQLTTHRGDGREFKSWPQSIHPDDYDRVMQAYQEAFTLQKQLRTEFRALGEQNPWRLLLLTPLGSDSLQHVSLREYGGFICSVVDITSEKKAEFAERAAAKDARERREQQERFIDMISHEIRNPLSAMLHSSEDIEDAINDPNNVDITRIQEAIEAIGVCIQHQRNIVDDVLSFSKLDGAMLSLTPKVCLPDRQLATSLKMFQSELQRQDIQLGFSVDLSYVELNVSWVMADMARISQVLINLVSNAIKFTKKSPGEKMVTVSVGASAERPSSYPRNIVFFDAEDHARWVNATSKPNWGDGDAVYIMVAIKDTGIGISEANQQQLFERFRVRFSECSLQATPKTVEVYGGSGLGLNISRKICQLHGGEVGLSSKAGDGSTFGFFFKTKRPEQTELDAGCMQEQEIADTSLEYQIKQLCALEKIDASSFSRNSVNPPAEDTGDTIAHFGDQESVKHQNTAQVDSNTREKEPAHQGPYAHELDHESQDHSQHPKNQASPAQRRTRVHVLLAEDNIINQKIVVRKLESRGYVVTAANNGKEAVELVERAPGLSTGDKRAFNICLMDMEMPVMDGNSATKMIREFEKQGRIEHIPILGVTANVRLEQQAEMKLAGMASLTPLPRTLVSTANFGQNDVISKPYKIGDMVRKISQILGSLNGQ